MDLSRVPSAKAGSKESPLLSVLMPTYNEQRTLRTIVQRVLASPIDIPLELICVDDGSTDATLQVLKELAAADSRIRVICQPSNQGKGAALIRALQQAQGDIILIQDADLEYDPSDYPTLLEPLLQGKADAVFGSRYASSPQRRVLLYWHSAANQWLTWMANVLNDINITDMETCYKVVRADILKQIPLQSQRFSIEPELTTRLAQWGARIYEVPISYYGRGFDEGKKIGLHDALEAVWSLLKFRFWKTRFSIHEGFYLRQSMLGSRRYKQWMLEQFSAYVGARIFEAGCGIGNFTQQLLEKERLICVDHDPLFSESIGRRYGHLENLRTAHIDFEKPEAYEAFQGEKIDTILSLNVLEDVEDDDLVLRQFYHLLEPQGYVIVSVPANPALWSPADEKLGHRRRYHAAELHQKMEAAGFHVIKIQPFNRLGGLGWQWNRWRGGSNITPTHLKLFEWLCPVARLVEHFSFLPHLSLIGIGQKQEAAS